MSHQPLIKVSQLTKTYKTHDGQGVEVRALAGIDLEIQAGEYISIMGPSGSGKSTLMQILGLLDRASSGSYLLAGDEVTKMSEDETAALRVNKIGFVFQFFNLLPRTKSKDNVALPLLYKGEAQPEIRAEKLLQQVGLGDRLDHRPHQLSGGQQQRVAIARALANQPQIIFADEPTGNISSQQTEEILDMFEELNRQGVTIIVVTHEPDVAKRARRMITIKDGLVAEDQLLREKTFQNKHDTLPLLNEPAPRKNFLQLQKRVFENLRMAIVALKLNLLRTLLATLGIIIGIASFVAMVAVGEGAQKAVADVMSTLGTNVLNVTAATSRSSRGAGDQTRRFILDDFDALKDYARTRQQITGVDAQVYGDGVVTAQGRSTITEIVGATEVIETMQNFKPQIGRFFTAEENESKAKVILIGQTIAQKLFDDRNPVGSRLRLNKVDFEIIGVLPKKGSTSFKDRDEVVMMPLKTAMFRTMGRRNIGVFTVAIRETQAMVDEEQRLREWWRERRNIQSGQEDDFNIRNMNDIQEIYTQTTGIISSMLQVISFVSLLVGGTGIMNVMFVSVKERTREVGLRKALGARRSDIMTQFLVESVLICSLGGAVGTVLGYLLSVAAGSWLNWQTYFTISSVFIAFIFSFLVGLIFGLWPAKQASELSPVEALRYE